MDPRLMLGRDAILGHKDDRIDSVEVEELGGPVGIATLTAGEADQLRKSAEIDLPFTVQVVILGACDAEGKRLFTKRDGEKLSALPAQAVGKIAQAILTHNRLTGEAQDEAKNG